MTPSKHALTYAAFKVFCHLDNLDGAKIFRRGLNSHDPADSQKLRVFPCRCAGWSTGLPQCCCLTLLCHLFMGVLCTFSVAQHSRGSWFILPLQLPASFFLHQSGTQHKNKTTQWPPANFVLVSRLLQNKSWHRRPSSSDIPYGNPKNRDIRSQSVFCEASAMCCTPVLWSLSPVWSAISVHELQTAVGG